MKLFGQPIELPDTTSPAESNGAVSVPCSDDPVAEEQSSEQDPPCSSSSMLEENNSYLNAEKDQESIKCLPNPNETDYTKRENQYTPIISEDLSDNLSDADNKDDVVVSQKTSNAEDGSNEAINSPQDKTLTKPDKILPCPRCSSTDTKFCYFNNYSVNQPRHFCKNCQRYWTAGGSMRNVPVRAGRRKNKNNPQLRHLTVPEGPRADLQNRIHRERVAFTSDGPLCESMASVLNIADKRTNQNTPRNGFRIPASSQAKKENGEGNLSGGSAMGREMGKIGSTVLSSNHNNPFSSWVYHHHPWSSLPWNPLMSPNATFRPTSFPLPFYSTPSSTYWAWNGPRMVPQGPTASSVSGPNSPTLGKHPRDGTAISPESFTMEEKPIIKESNSKEKSLWVPKTLRIDDPEEAAKSSIWATLGLKNETNEESVSGSGVFEGFKGRRESKVDEKTRVSENSTVLKANPAALSRSLSFHESS